MTTYQQLVDKYGFIDGLVGTNENDECVMVSIDDDTATLRTIQENGWNRINVYHKDGTEEELYER